MDTALTKFIDYLQKERNYSLKTIVAYRSDVRSFLNFSEIFEITFDEVTYEHVRSWIVSLSESGLSNNSINRKISALKGFYRFLQHIGLVQVNPLQLHKSLKTGSKVQLPFTIEEIDAVTTPLLVAEDFAGFRDLMVIELLYNLGLRRSELVNIKVADVDFLNNFVKVLGKGDKMRYIPMVASLSKMLAAYLIDRADFLKPNQDTSWLIVDDRGNKVKEMFVYRLINRYFSDVTSKEKKSPHMLRHSFATHLIENGADINSIKELMGHQSLATTQLYAQVNLKELKKVYASTHPRMATKKN